MIKIIIPSTKKAKDKYSFKYGTFASSVYPPSKNVHTIAYKNQYSYPNNLPPFELGAFDFWWFDNKKAEILESK